MKTLFKFISWIFSLIILGAFVFLNFTIFGVGIFDWNADLMGFWFVVSTVIIDFYYIKSEWVSFRKVK